MSPPYILHVTLNTPNVILSATYVILSATYVILSEAEESTRVPTSTPDPRNQKHHVTPSRAYPTHTIIPGPPTPTSPAGST